MGANEPFLRCLHMQEYNGLRRGMLFNEDMRFVVDGLFYCALLLVFYFNQH